MEHGAANMAHTFDENTVSDLHKEAYGSRPGAGWWGRWRGMSSSEKQEEWDHLLSVAEQEAEQERQAEERARVRWDAHINQMMADNGIDRATALRWDMQAMGAGGDEGISDRSVKLIVGKLNRNPETKIKDGIAWVDVGQRTLVAYTEEAA
jgi:hypothetical protein